jgi:prepilin-type N-terminal cleavage/methylation domain-containing protein
MKKLIKNYLAKLQENDKKGFSLVELIIVMAIMAILVGIVASQVLPYMDKSRQSKDQQKLSSICTDLVSATAQSSVALSDLPATDVTTTTWGTAGESWDKVRETFSELQGGQITAYANFKLASKEATKTGQKVLFDYSSGTGLIKVYLSGHSADYTDSTGTASTKYVVASN